MPPSAPSFPSLTTSGIDPIHRSEINEAFPAAKYTCPFGEEKHSAVSLRVQSRKNRRTPVNIVEMPRPKSRPRRDTVSAASVPPTTTSDPFYMFFSLPNTPDSENPVYIERRKRPLMTTIIPGVGTESYI